MKNTILTDINDYRQDHPTSKYSYLIRGNEKGLDEAAIREIIAELVDDGFIEDDGFYATITEAGITEAEK